MSVVDAGLNVGRVAFLRELVACKSQIATLVEKATGMIGDDLAGQAVRGNAKAITKLFGMGEKLIATQGENVALKSEVVGLRGKVQELAAKELATAGTSGQTNSIKAMIPNLRNNLHTVDMKYGRGDADFWVTGFSEMRSANHNALNTIETLANTEIQAANAAGKVVSPQLKSIKTLIPVMRDHVNATNQLYGRGDADFWVMGFSDMRKAGRTLLDTFQALL